jgi:hypothetical protein
MTKLLIHLRIFDDGERIVEISGPNARTLLALVEAGPIGVVPEDLSLHRESLQEHRNVLSGRYGLDIQTAPMRTGSGWTPRLVLQTPVEILSISGNAWTS